MFQHISGDPQRAATTHAGRPPYPGVARRLRLRGPLLGGMAPKGFSFGITSDKAQMQSLGDAVAARLELEQGFTTQDPDRPPPQFVCLQGAALAGMARGFVGYYERQPKRELARGAPAYRHTRNPVLWLCRDAEGIWRGQVESKIGQPSSLLKRVDDQCLHPNSASDEAWQYVSPDTQDWEKAWSLTCREASAEEVAGEQASREAPPAFLALEAATTPPTGLAAGFLGVYRRRIDRDPQTREEAEREVADCPAWCHVGNPSLWLARGPDGGWLAQGESSLGTLAAHLRLRDAVVLAPSDARPVDGGVAAHWLMHDGGRGWVELAGMACRAATRDEAEAAIAALPPPPQYLLMAEQAAPPAGPAASSAAVPHAHLGLYELQAGHVNHAPAWKRTHAPRAGDDGGATEDTWLVRGRNGCWVGQKASQFGRDVGVLQLPDTVCSEPTTRAGSVPWQVFASRTWQDVPAIVCRAVAAAEHARATSELTLIPRDAGRAQSEVAAPAERDVTHVHAHEHGHDDAGGGEACDHEGCSHPAHAAHAEAGAEHAHHSHEHANIHVD